MRAEPHFPWRAQTRCMARSAVFRRPEAVAVHDAKLELSFGLVLLGGSGQPAEGGDVVARNPFSPRVDQPKFRLRDGIASIRQGREHLDGARIIVHGVTDQRIRQLIGGCGLTELGGDHATQNECAEAGCCARQEPWQGESGAHRLSHVAVPGIAAAWARSEWRGCLLAWVQTAQWPASVVRKVSPLKSPGCEAIHTAPNVCVSPRGFKTGCRSGRNRVLSRRCADVPGRAMAAAAARVRKWP